MVVKGIRRLELVVECVPGAFIDLSFRVTSGPGIRTDIDTDSNIDSLTHCFIMNCLIRVRGGRSDSISCVE